MQTVVTNRSINRDYLLLWAGSGLSNLGDGIRLTALPLLAATLTRCSPPRLLSGSGSGQSADPLSIGLAATVGIMIGPFGVTLFTVVGRTLRQALTPDRLLGRVVVSFRLIGIGALPVGALFGGWLARSAGLRSPYLIGSALISVAALMVYRVSTEERMVT